MNDEKIEKILSKIKNTVGENNYKLALAITGHRPGKIRDVVMSSKDGELLLEYITKLQNNWNELKKWVKEYEENSYGLGSYETGIADGLGDVLKKMQELQGDDKN